jgi:hypothetical protein
MTDVNRPTQRMPKGRLTISKGGSLLGYHGPVSRRIKLWTADAKSDPTVGKLEGAYFTALRAVDRMEERREKNVASGRLTEEGMKADALQFARNDLLPALDRARETINRAKGELADRKAKLASRHDLEEAIASAESAVEAAHEEVLT